METETDFDHATFAEVEAFLNACDEQDTCFDAEAEAEAVETAAREAAEAERLDRAIDAVLWERQWGAP